jgi:hypothetical protein
VEEDGVARRRIDAVQVLEPDHVAAGKALDAAGARHVDEPSARDDLRDGLDPEPPHAGRAGELGDRPAVVGAVARLQVAQRVEVRAELLRPAHLLGDPVDAVVADPAVRVRVMRRGDERLAEVAPREHRDGLVEHAPEVVQPPLADERERLAARALVDVVEHAELVAGAERGGPPRLGRRRPRGRLRHSDDHGVRKLGNSVRPPSTNSVWPVM